jgi:DNA (cytosine-5)-methyltransferase 1
VIHKDKPRLNPAFVEWMMGLPAGHVTGHGLSAAQELKMLGNGVVPQQAALALQLLAVST